MWTLSLKMGTFFGSIIKSRFTWKRISNRLEKTLVNFWKEMKKNIYTKNHHCMQCELRTHSNVKETAKIRLITFPFPLHAPECIKHKVYLNINGKISNLLSFFFPPVPFVVILYFSFSLWPMSINRRDWRTYCSNNVLLIKAEIRVLDWFPFAIYNCATDCELVCVYVYVQYLDVQYKSCKRNTSKKSIKLN